MNCKTNSKSFIIQFKINNNSKSILFFYNCEIYKNYFIYFFD